MNVVLTFCDNWERTDSKPEFVGYSCMKTKVKEVNKKTINPDVSKFSTIE